MKCQSYRSSYVTCRKKGNSYMSFNLIKYAQIEHTEHFLSFKVDVFVEA